ncbi:MAG: amidohydrolase family protein [Nanoarchaeota archaeon]|nr:amidohydrolase family protein [Nanoarchaeota archaeon]
MKKIDMHCHTTNRTLPGLLYQSATLGDIKEEMEKYDIEKTVVLASYFPHKGSGISNFRLYNWIRSRPEFLLFGSLDMGVYFRQGYNELEELAELGVLRGIKIYTGYQQMDMQGSKMRDVIKLAQDVRVPLMFHGGDLHNGKEYADRSHINPVTPKDVGKLADEFPMVPMIVSHLANPYFAELRVEVKHLPNLFADMSGVMNSLSDKKDFPRYVEEVERFLMECSSSKLLFGTDFPIQSHKDSIALIEQATTNLGLSDADRFQIYWGNAKNMGVVGRVK